MQREITIDSRLFAVYPDIRLGVMQFRADVREPSEDFWSYMRASVLPQAREAITGRQWGEIPGIRGSRAAYRAFGRDPARYRVSSEALLRRVRRGDEPYRINSVVDVNNLISIQSGLSVGSYDLDRIRGGIVFRKAEQGEGYTGIGKDFLDMSNLLVLADGDGIFGSTMSDSTRTMVTAETKNVLTVIYCFESGIDLGSLVDEAARAFSRFAGVSDVETRIIEE